jgi:hypothetical protein
VILAVLIIEVAIVLLVVDIAPQEVVVVSAFLIYESSVIEGTGLHVAVVHILGRHPRLARIQIR